MWPRKQLDEDECRRALSLSLSMASAYPNTNCLTVFGRLNGMCGSATGLRLVLLVPALVVVTKRKHQACDKQASSAKGPLHNERYHCALLLLLLLLLLPCRLLSVLH